MHNFFVITLSHAFLKSEFVNSPQHFLNSYVALHLHNGCKKCEKQYKEDTSNENGERSCCYYLLAAYACLAVIAIILMLASKDSQEE